MRPQKLKSLIRLCIEHQLPILIKGAPGVGKSDIITQACAQLNIRLIISHPVVSDPTDYKGLPFPSADKQTATFLPFGELSELITTQEKTVFFLDDLGQAPASVQAACMQLILARRINGHKISDNVTFIAATNRREDKAGVMGILEPVKSRFAAIVELEVNLEDWTVWAIENDMPTELISFIRFRPALLHDFKATNDIINSPCPRTVAYVGKLLKVKIGNDIANEAIQGAVGAGFATEFQAFREIYSQIPPAKVFIEAPDTAPLYQETSYKYAVCGMLIEQANRKNFDNIAKYVKRMPEEFLSMTMIAAAKKKDMNISQTQAFVTWATENADMLIME